MGIDCKIRLPEDVRVRDVADVVALLAGRPFRWVEQAGGRWIEVDAVEVRSLGDVLVECAEILIAEGPGVVREKLRVLYHFEPSEGGRLLMPRATAAWVAVGRRLVEFFGGSVDYNDCDGIQEDYRARPPRDDNKPENGVEWNTFQAAKAAVVPLTEAEVAAAVPLAAYGDTREPKKGGA